MGSTQLGAKELHAVCVPFPAQGHVNPMMQLAKLLHSRGFRITFVNTEFNHRRLIRSRGSDSVKGLPDFQFGTIPDGLPPSDKDATQDVPAICDSTRKTCQGPFKELVTKLNSSSEVPQITCIVSDGLTGFGREVAKELGIPEVQFWTASACGFMAYLQYSELVKRGIVPFKGNWMPKEDEALTVAYIKVSEDMEKGTNQSKEGLWARIQQTYLEYYEGTKLPKARSEESCNSRWKKHIFPNMNKWHQCLKRSERRDQSGANLQDIQRQAESFYRDDSGGQPFKFGNCYNLCKDWVAFQDPPQEQFGPTPVQRNTSISLEEDEDPIEDSPTSSQTQIPRPMGRNAARKTRQKGKEAEVKAIGEEMVAGMREMAAQMKEAEEERKRREKKREDRREVARLEAILMMQTIDFTPRSKEYFDGKKREALHKLQRRELFPNSGETSDVYRPQMPSDEDEA